MKENLDNMGTPLKEYFLREEDYKQFKESAKPGEVFLMKPEFFEPGEKLREVPGFVEGKLLRLMATLVSEEDFLPVGSKVEFDEL